VQILKTKPRKVEIRFTERNRNRGQKTEEMKSPDGRHRDWIELFYDRHNYAKYHSHHFHHPAVAYWTSSATAEIPRDADV